MKNLKILCWFIILHGGAWAMKAIDDKKALAFLARETAKAVAKKEEERQKDFILKDDIDLLDEFDPKNACVTVEHVYMVGSGRTIKPLTMYRGKNIIYEKQVTTPAREYSSITKEELKIEISRRELNRKVDNFMAHDLEEAIRRHYNYKGSDCD